MKINKKYFVGTIGIITSLSVIGITETITNKNIFSNNDHYLKSGEIIYRDVASDNNALQVANLQKLKDALKTKIKIKSPTDKASDIAKRINSVTTLKNELGIDLTKLPKSSTYDISATGEDKKIKLLVTMHTQGATTPDSSLSVIIDTSKHKNNLIDWTTQTIIAIAVIGGLLFVLFMMSIYYVIGNKNVNEK